MKKKWALLLLMTASHVLYSMDDRNDERRITPQSNITALTRCLLPHGRNLAYALLPLAADCTSMNSTWSGSGTPIAPFIPAPQQVYNNSTWIALSIAIGVPTLVCFAVAIAKCNKNKCICPCIKKPPLTSDGFFDEESEDEKYKPTLASDTYIELPVMQKHRSSNNNNDSSSSSSTHPRQ